jgi:hypothetical protein
VGVDARTGHARIGGDLAEVLHAAGRSQAADDTYAEAAARYARKHNLAQVAQVRERLAELHHVGLST